MNFLKNKENVKQVSLGIIAVLCICLGVANYNGNEQHVLGSEKDIIEVEFTDGTINAEVL